MFKRTLAWMMALAMLMSMTIVPVNADDKLSAGVDDGETVLPGGEISLNLNLSGNPGLQSLSLRVYYESDKLECTAVDEYGAKEGVEAVPNIWDAFTDTTTKKDTAQCLVTIDDTSNNRRDSNKWSLISLGYMIKAANTWNTNGVLAKLTFKAKEGLTSPVDAAIETEIISASDINDVTLSAENTQGLNAVVHIGGNQTTYTVKFDTGASGATVAPLENVPNDTTISAPTPAPQWTGHDFGGWYKEAECVNAWNFETDKVTANTTLYAKWTQVVPGPWKVEFNTGASGATVAPLENVPNDTTIAAPTPAPQWAGHEFGGWYKEAECVNAWNFETDKVTANTTLYAKWTAPLYNVNIAANLANGTVTSAPENPVAKDATVTLTVTPAQGYELKSDSLTVTDADRNKIPVTPAENTDTDLSFSVYTFAMPASDVTVNAEFEEDTAVTVTYAPGAGSGEAFSKKEKQPFELPGKPDAFTPPSNQNFDGWKRSGDDALYKPGQELNLLSDTTLTAHYSPTPSPDAPCYVATAVYGSYDCPEVWTLRRFRDHVLAKTWYGRLFIRLYYAVSPTAVRLFGGTEWFQNFWRGKLDNMVSDLQAQGFESTPYHDIDW